MKLNAEIAEMDVQQSEIDCDKQNIKKEKKKSKKKEEITNVSVLKSSEKIVNGENNNTKVRDKPKRKRKHKGIADDSAGETNRKIAKVSPNDKSGVSEMHNDKCDDNKIPEKENIYLDIQKQVSGGTHNEIVDEQITEKEIQMFNGKFLRKSFASGEGLDILKKFVVICKENQERDLAAEYLNAGGSLLEILRLIDTPEKKGIGNIVTVFSAINILLMKILAQYPQYQSSAGEACRHLINSHLSFVHSMLSVKSNFRNRKIVLKLLAAMVSLGGSLPREVLAHLKIQADALELLTKHSRPADEQSVRTCYIYFVLAFLVEGNATVIRSFLEKGRMLSSIFHDLMYDSQKIVNLVLTTVKTYVLENPGISKTLKLSVFPTPVVLDIVALYNWKGPKNWKQRANNVYATSDAFLEEKEITTSIVHDFLITLLTSHRHGIIFHDYSLGTSGHKHNLLVNTVLLSLDRAWEHQKPADLVVKILSACPDLIRSQYNSISPYLEPRFSIKWVKAIKFVRKIIEAIDGDNCFKSLSPELSIFQVVSATVGLTLPSSILLSAIIPALESPHLVVRHEGIVTIVVMFRKLKEFYEAVKTHCRDFVNFDAFKSNATNYILKYVPGLEMILEVWEETLKPKTDTEDSQRKNDMEDPTKHEHLSNILDLLHLYREICPEILDVSTRTQLNTLLKGIDELESFDDEELSIMKVKAIQFLLAFDSSEFAPQKDTFASVLTFLINLLDRKPSRTPADILDTFKMLLNLSGVFEGCLEQIDIWIHCFRNATNADEKAEVVNWFVDSVKSAVKHTNKYTNLISKAEESSREHAVNTGRIEDIFDELSTDVESNGDRKRVCKALMQPTVAIPIILPSALRKIRSNPSPVLLRHSACILVYTLHCQVLPGPLLKLTEDIEQLPPHLAGWIINKPTHIKKIFPSMHVAWRLSKALTEDDELNAAEIISSEDPLTRFEVITSFRLTVFYLTQFAHREILTERINENCRRAMESLLKEAKRVNEEEDSKILNECCRCFFMHPVVLHFFSPLRRNKRLAENFITNETFPRVCRVVSSLGSRAENERLFAPFKNKLIEQLQESVEKGKKRDHVDQNVITELLELLALKKQDIVSLLSALTKQEKDVLWLKENASLSIYGFVLPKLLRLLCVEEFRSDRSAELETDFVTKLFSCLIFLKNHNVDLVEWEEAVAVYLSSFPYNIPKINPSHVASLLKTKMNSSTVKLLSVLCRGSSRLASLFEKHSMKSESIMRDSSIVFPIFVSNLRHKWSREFLLKLKALHEQQILSYFSDPHSCTSWVEEIMYLIENTFDLETCRKISETTTRIGDKLDMVPLQYLHILESLYQRFASVEKTEENPLTIFLQILVHITTQTLKKESKNTEKLSVLCEKLTKTAKKLKEEKSDFALESLAENNSWPQFTRFSLKLGLKKVAKNDPEGLPLLKTLKELCDVTYRDDSANEYAKVMFEMTTSHSEFVNIMLTSSSLKRDLVELLWTLLRKNKSVLAASHVPLYLAAYNATLSRADQFLLRILRFYEDNSMRVSDYRPYLWGNAAATYYSVKGDTNTALWRQPSTSQVLGLFEIERIEKTIRKYPVERDLKAGEFRELEGAYDPAFYLPLLCHLLAENNVVACHKVMQSGALALVFAALASSSSDVRMAAYTVFSRFYFHLEATSSKDKLLWMRLVDALRQGIAALNQPLENIRLSCIASNFLARATMVSTQPLHPLYSPLHNFFTVKPALDLSTIPELLQLFHSPEIEHRTHRHWILEVIRDGMKTELDVQVAVKCMLFKMVMDFYTCVLSDETTKKLILEVLNASLRVPSACLLLIQNYGLLEWLSGSTSRLNARESSALELLVSILENIAENFGNSKRNHNHYRLILLQIMLSLKPSLSTNRNLSLFTRYLDVLRKILVNKTVCAFVHVQQLEDILGHSRRLLGNVSECENILIHGCEHAQENPQRKESENEVEVAKESLKSFVCTWVKFQKFTVNKSSRDASL